MATKELIIFSGEHQCMVDVSATDTLADLRPKILDEFDHDMLPDDESEDFYICIGGIRISSKQETKKLCWDIIAANRDVTLYANNAKHKSNKRASPEEAEKEQDKSAKRSRSTIDSNDKEDEDNKNDRQTCLDNNDQQKEEECSKKPEEMQPASKPVMIENSEASSEEEKVEASSTTNKSAGTATEDMSAKAQADANQSNGIDSGSLPVTTDNDAIMTESASTATTSSAPQKDDHMTVNTTVTESYDDEVTQLVVVESKNNLHEKYDKAISQSCNVLKDLDRLLQDPEHELFCSEERRKEWSNEIATCLKKSAPDTIIGCLGGTGVGKSSLLNALLDEAAVLPTSGSRGCTAAVVELRFNKDLLVPNNNNEVDVYKGQVEFMTLQEWHAELKVLIDECSTHESQKILLIPPEEQRSPDAAAAWAKIDQVYGSGTMRSMCGAPKAQAWDRLGRNTRIVQLLTPPSPGTQSNNTIVVKEGTADPEQSKQLIASLSNLKGKLRRLQKKWAKNFRSKINDYVYRKGNGGGPQTWPLIRKVVLHGPWAVLSTGACLVDLPGVRDANAARARVAQSYLQCCNKIWIVAPIKRAVDDGTAKELMGEQFKRRMLMDGNYGNVSFIATQTDDIEPTEIMRDHQDVAEKVRGRWDKMQSLLDKITELDKQQYDLHQEEDDLKVNLEEANEAIKDLKGEVKELEAEMEGDVLNVDNEDENAHVLKALKASLDDKRQLASEAKSKLVAWREEAAIRMKSLSEQSRSVQQRLKAICSVVRNEYSTKCLQDQFRAGLEEITRRPDEEELDAGTTAAAGDENALPPLPDDFQLEVFAISSNDYLKLTGVKPASDGQASTFNDVSDTQIPLLRNAVHQTTSHFRIQYTESFCNSASDLLDRVKLCATQNRDDSIGAARLRKAFNSEMENVGAKVAPIVSEFIRKSEQRVNATLRPSLRIGASKANKAAMTTVTSWGSKSRRTKQHRNPQNNGLHYATYDATMRRNGVYTSATVGAIDLNQELCDPAEAAFSADWQQIMDSSIRAYIAASEQQVMKVLSEVAQAVVAAFVSVGIDSTRLQSMATAASRSCTTALKAAFNGMREYASMSQRELNRSLLPKIASRMSKGYQTSYNSVGGTGKFLRMKDALQTHAQKTVHRMFDESTSELLKAIGDMVKEISSMIMATSQIISRSLASVYSTCWEQNNPAHMGTATFEKIREKRNALLPEIIRLRKAQDDTNCLVGIEREELEFDIVGVDTWEERKAKEMKEAQAKGTFIDLCDSSDEESDDENATRARSLQPAPAATATHKVKAEPDANKASPASGLTSKAVPTPTPPAPGFNTSPAFSATAHRYNSPFAPQQWYRGPPFSATTNIYTSPSALVTCGDCGLMVMPGPNLAYHQAHMCRGRARHATSTTRITGNSSSPVQQQQQQQQYGTL